MHSQAYPPTNHQKGSLNCRKHPGNLILQSPSTSHRHILTYSHRPSLSSLSSLSSLRQPTSTQHLAPLQLQVMNLSSLVHAGRYQSERNISTYSPRPQQTMASSLVTNPYTTQPLAHNLSYSYVTAPQPPPSPPVDETSKCSLPSISSLLGMADSGSPKEQTQPQPQQTG